MTDITTKRTCNKQPYHCQENIYRIQISDWNKNDKEKLAQITDLPINSENI